MLRGVQLKSGKAHMKVVLPLALALALLPLVSFGQVTIEPNAVRRHTDDSTINELVRVIRARGYKCDSVSAAIPWPVNPGYTVRCNQFNYTYHVEDKGGRWVVSVR
jgi:hypothetical protein